VIRSKSALYEDYPLQGTSLDVPITQVLRLTDERRENYIHELLDALYVYIEADMMAFKNRVTFRQEIADYRALLRKPADSYLYIDDKTSQSNVLGIKSPGSLHAYHSRTQMWKMVTKQGALKDLIATHDEAIVSRIQKLLDPKNQGKAIFRKSGRMTLQVIYAHLQMNYSVGAAFPPFHAKFFADRYLPKEGDCLVIDPCAGWGGRLLGTLCVKRKEKVTYVGVDPEKRNQEAYETLLGLYNKYLKKESKSERASQIYYEKFEDWIDTDDASQFFGKTDLVITSPPYFNAELYNSENENQSANSYKTYPEWREKFYRKLVQGAFDLLKPGGTFVLNIANVSSAENLEKDARVLAKEIGFKGAGFYKLAMSVVPGTSGSVRHSVVVEGAKFKIEPCFVFEKPIAPAKRFIAITKKTAIAKTESVGKVKLPPKTKTVPWEVIKQLYKSYDATCSDSFKRIKQKDKAKFIFLNGKPVAGFVLNQRSSAGHECLYKGKSRSVPSIAYFKGDTEVTKFAVFDASAKKAILEALAGLKRPCIVEVNASSKPEITILQSAGFEFADASVNSFGDIYHMYIDKEHVKERLLPIESAERINLKRLSSLDFSALATKIAKRLERLENSLEFAVHPSNYNINETWSAVALRGYLPAPEFIESLEENSAYQNKHNEKWLKLFKKSQHGLQNTSLMAQFPEVQKILDAIVPQSAKSGNSAFKRVRFMKLAPKEGELERHTDLTDQSLGIEDGRTIRLHVPIKTNPSVKVTSWGLDNQASVKHLKQGELWYLNIRCPHKVINAGKTERIHLVIDVVSNESIRALITGPTSKTLKPVISKSEDLEKNADYYLKLVRGWKDPNPKPVIENWEGFQVVRDDLLAHGSKERFIDFMVKTAKETEFVFGASNKVGWGAISLSAVCRKYNKKAVFFMAKTANPTWHQQEVLRLGGRIEWVANGMLNVTQARAREYASKNPQKRRLLPIGLEDETVLGSIIKVAQGMKIAPKEVWTVASSGTLSRGLQLAFPDAKFYAVQTGHTLTAESAGRAKVFVSPYKFDKPVKLADAPAYPSEVFYDAKLWQFVRKYGVKGALIWNVAG
jgi:tRNA1(Val) A37 N6-methylase TrmN6